MNRNYLIYADSKGYITTLNLTEFIKFNNIKNIDLSKNKSQNF